MKRSEPALHEGISSQGDNEEVEDILCNPSSLSVWLYHFVWGLKWRGWPVFAALSLWHWPLTFTESLHSWRSLKKTKRNPKEIGSTTSLEAFMRSRRDRANSAVGSLQCGCCLLWCGWPFQHHIALQDSDKTSWEVTKCPCGGHNTHTGDIQRGKTHTGATSWPRNIVWLRSLVQFPFPTAGSIPSHTWQLEGSWH